MYRRKQVLLFFLSTVLLTAFFLLPPYYEWGRKLLGYAGEFDRQRHHMTLEERKLSRWEPYRISRNISDSFLLNGLKDTLLVLVPSTAYFNNYKIDYTVPEPAVFYYYTGLKTIWSNSSGARKANYLIGVNNGRIVLEPVRSSKQLADSIKAFNKFPPVL